MTPSGSSVHRGGSSSVPVAMRAGIRSDGLWRDQYVLAMARSNRESPMPLCTGARSHRCPGAPLGPRSTKVPTRTRAQRAGCLWSTDWPDRQPDCRSATSAFVGSAGASPPGAPSAAPCYLELPPVTAWRKMRAGTGREATHGRREHPYRGFDTVRAAVPQGRRTGSPCGRDSGRGAPWAAHVPGRCRTRPRPLSWQRARLQPLRLPAAPLRRPPRPASMPSPA